MGERDHKKLGAICEARLIKDQMSAEGIVAAAGEAACDLITMASHGRWGAARMLLGIQAQNVRTLGGRQKGGRSWSYRDTIPAVRRLARLTNE